MKTIVIICSLMLSELLTAQSNYIGSGISLLFDGDYDDYINVGDFYNDLDYPFSVEAWIKVEYYTVPYSCIFASDNPTVNYYGFWFQLNSWGEVRLELGDGSGAGPTDRKGRQTLESVPINEWVHVAVVCNSASDIDFYFNGVEKASSATDGEGSVPSITHNSENARIGNLDTPYDFHPFNGQIDEIRLWDSERTVTEIRENMCKKLTGTESNLIGYWITDESYTTTTLTDYSTSGADGSIVGSIERITSGAPIGNASEYLYTTDWAGVKLTILSDNEDFFRVKGIENEPLGMHIYRVDDYPYSVDGLNEYPDYYYGVFPVNNLTPAEFGISYHFSYENGVVTSDNVTSSSLFHRNNGAEETWNDLTAELYFYKNFLREVGNTTRKEIIFNILDDVAPKVSLNTIKDLVNSEVILFPNPSTDYVAIKNVNFGSIISILDMNGKKIIDDIIVDKETIQLDVSTMETGIFLIEILNDNSLITYKLIIQ